VRAAAARGHILGGGGGGEGELGYEETQAWRLAVFFVGFLLISVGGESLLHKLEHHAKEKKMHGLNETVKKCKDELMLLGFISMLLVICQENILGICVPDSWDPTNATVAGAQRRALASIEVECPEGRVQFITISALHQVHIFIFLMGLSHIVTGSVTMVLCMARIKKWRQWESYGDSFEAVLRGTQRAAPSGRRASLGTKANIERMRRSSITTLASDEAMTKEEWMLKAITEPNSKCMATTRDLFLGGDMLMYLYLRRYFIRKHRRKQDFDFLKYITQCMADEYAKTMDLSAGDWTVATLTVLLVSPCPYSLLVYC
jgi:mlo protein